MLLSPGAPESPELVAQPPNRAAVPNLIVPAAIEDVIAEFSARSVPFAAIDVHSALCAARRSLIDPSPEENHGAFAEVLASGLTTDEHSEKPWGTYFGPIGSRTNADGNVVYFPDATQADATIFAHWKQRAGTVMTSVMRARYNDLAWDMAQLVGGERRPDASCARSAIDAYLLVAGDEHQDLHEAFPSAKRALILALQLHDTTRRDAARNSILALHRRAAEQEHSWWCAWDILIEQRHAGLTDAERESLVADLEAELAHASDETPGRFNPHDVELIAERLIPHYRRLGRAHDVLRLNLALAKAFEHFGNMGDPLLASMVYHTSMEAYRAAGLPAEEARLLRLIEESNVAASAEMTVHEFRREVSHEELDTFLAQVIAESKQETLKRIAQSFLMLREPIEQSLQETARKAPLSAFIPMSIINGSCIEAQIGGLDDDPIGRLIFHARQHSDLSTFFLFHALTRAREQHELTVEDLASWVNRTGLFGDCVLLNEGVAAWLAGDHYKAAHILVPQVEAGFRTLLSRRGCLTTKENPNMRPARMVITMGELLCNETCALALGSNGPSLILHFRCLYTDPRGENWRNAIAHGLLAANRIDAGMLVWVIHSLLLLGLWLQPDTAQPTVTPAVRDRE